MRAHVLTLSGWARSRTIWNHHDECALRTCCKKAASNVVSWMGTSLSLTDCFKKLDSALSSILETALSSLCPPIASTDHDFQCAPSAPYSLSRASLETSAIPIFWPAAWSWRSDWPRPKCVNIAFRASAADTAQLNISASGQLRTLLRFHLTQALNTRKRLTMLAKFSLTQRICRIRQLWQNLTHPRRIPMQRNGCVSTSKYVQVMNGSVLIEHRHLIRLTADLV